MVFTGTFPQTRLRRLRQNGFIRELVREYRLHPSDLVWPIFVIDGENTREQIKTMPGIERLSIDLALDEARKAYDFGIQAVALFPVTPENKKCEHGKEAYNADNLMCRAIAAFKQALPDLGLITDVALDPYTAHGHDGLVKDGIILNDETVEILCKQALNQAKAGADIIAPSDMMDGRIGEIRRALDTKKFKDTMILSYAAKYASCFYGPFRDAVGSERALKGDKKTYQMNPANRTEALREVQQDITEGADIIMVKPGLPYLDIIRDIRDEFAVPLSAYHVSGEYAALKFAAQAGALNYEDSLLESLLSFKRSGVDFVLTYGAVDAAKLLQH